MMTLTVADESVGDHGYQVSSDATTSTDSTSVLAQLSQDLEKTKRENATLDEQIRSLREDNIRLSYERNDRNQLFLGALPVKPQPKIESVSKTRGRGDASLGNSQPKCNNGSDKRHAEQTVSRKPPKQHARVGHTQFAVFCQGVMMLLLLKGLIAQFV